MPDLDGVIKELENVLSRDPMDVPYDLAGYTLATLIDTVRDEVLRLGDTLNLLKQDRKMIDTLFGEVLRLSNRTGVEGQAEREKRICKAICDLIRGPLSVDTDADKDYVCHLIQQIFINGGKR